MSEAGRWLLAFALLGSWYGHLLTLLTADRMGYDRRLQLAWADLRQPRKLRWLLASLPYLLLLWLFGAGVLEPWSALAVLGALFALRRACFAAWPAGVVREAGKYVPAAAALFAYALAELAASALPPELRVRFGWEAACGVFAASYVLSGLAKLHKSGWAWTSAGVMALLLAERAHGAPRPLRQLRLAVVQRPALCANLGRAALLLELGAVLFVIPALRGPMFCVLTALQLGIALLLGYLELEWIVLGLAVTLGSASA